MLRRFRMLMTTLVVVGLTAGVVVGVASATPATVGSGWQTFGWGGGDGAIPAASPYTFTAATPVVVTVTDAFCKGDRFTVSDGATTLGTTAAVPVVSCSDPSQISDPDLALASTAYSHGLFAVGPGNHSIGLVVSTSPFGGGAAYIRFDTLTLTANDCKKDGWRAYGNFKNQGDCVSFVATGGTNLPAGG